MKLSNRQTRLFDFVKEQHGEQKRKYTGFPYWHHLRDVAYTISYYPSVAFGVEIAMCHDLLEDTDCNYIGLLTKLSKLGYLMHDAAFIANGVQELTDQFTHEAYPEMNRKARKDSEAQRLVSISANSQSVKYADIIDNTTSIAEHDPGFAKVYLPEIGKIIYRMDKGHPDLHKRCLEVYESACETLKINPHV